MNERGDAAEARALAWLQARGLRCLARNYRCRLGEIDLIMQDGDTVVFVEVRQRRSARFGGAAASITPAKQARLTLAAEHYLQTQCGGCAPSNSTASKRHGGTLDRVCR